jgi:hypothetical protein
VLQCRQVIKYSLNYLINLRFIGLGITVERVVVPGKLIKMIEALLVILVVYVDCQALQIWAGALQDYG